MKTQVTFRHFQSNPELHQAALDAADSLTKYHDGIISADFTFVNDHSKIAEFNVHVQGHNLVVKEESDDFFKSLNVATDTMVRQIKKIKNKNS